MQTQNSNIVFKVGTRQIEAPIKNGSLQENINALMKSFPQFRWTHILPEDAEVLADGRIQYTLQLPPLKSNG